MSTPAEGSVAPRVVILDFGGVCTFSPLELRGGAQSPSTSPGTIVPDPTRPECRDAVARLRSAGLVVAILSNELDRAWVGSMPILSEVDFVVSCSDNGILKPDRRAYERVLLVTRARPEEVLFVDDEPDNIAGAEALGIESVLFDTGQPQRSWEEIVRRVQSM